MMMNHLLPPESVKQCAECAHILPVCATQCLCLSTRIYRIREELAIKVLLAQSLGRAGNTTENTADVWFPELGYPSIQERRGNLTTVTTRRPLGRTHVDVCIGRAQMFKGRMHGERT